MPRVMDSVLSEKERTVWHAIANYIRDNRISPSHKELIIAVENPSESMMNRHLAALREKGFITWVPRSPRSIVMLKWPDGKRPRL